MNSNVVHLLALAFGALDTPTRSAIFKKAMKRKNDQITANNEDENEKSQEIIIDSKPDNTEDVLVYR